MRQTELVVSAGQWFAAHGIITNDDSRLEDSIHNNEAVIEYMLNMWGVEWTPEAAAAKQAAARKKQEQEENEIPSYVPWDKRQDWIQNRRAMDQAAAAKAKKLGATETQAEKQAEGTFKEMAENVTTRSNLENASIRKLFVMKPGTSDIDWKATYRQRQIAAERYNTRSSMAGR